VSDRFLQNVASITREAGQIAFGKWRGDFEQWDKSPGNPVSEVDLAVDHFLRGELASLDPEAGWLSEETADDAERLLRSRVWVVDPIDGTRDFVRGRPGWAVSVALVEAGRPVIAVLDAPARNEHWQASLGGGATRNSATLVASRCSDWTNVRVPADVLPKSDSDLTMVEKPNSIALRMAMIAADEADLVATLRWGHEWDIAAAALIVSEAGARVTDAHGSRLRYNSTKGEAFGVLAAASMLHPMAVERLAERAKKASIRET
jgi:myo-inositol-1(or 4)-monophosphatase